MQTTTLCLFIITGLLMATGILGNLLSNHESCKPQKKDDER